MKYTILITMLILCSSMLQGKSLHVGNGYTYATLSSAMSVVKAGDSIICHNSSIPGGMFFSNIHGEQAKYIYLIAEKNKTVVLQGGSNSIQFSDCSYMQIEGFTIQGQTGNGMNIDDAGSFDSPSHHLIIKNCVFRDINATGNNDLLKLSGIDYFEITKCRFINGSTGGSGIDMVGCHFGRIEENAFENMGTNAIQAKGGSHEIDIWRNQFKNAGARALNIGGSTGLEFFRPQNAKTEAERIRVRANVIEGSEAAVAFVGATQIEVSNNTIVLPNKWVLRILQETVDESRFLPSGNNTFFNNIIIINNNVNTEVNIGPNTAPQTFKFENNIWYKSTNTNWAGPTLPGTVSKQLIQNPLIINGTLYQLDKTSPAIGYGKPHTDKVKDILGNQFSNPPSCGAFEGKSSTLPTSEKTQYSIAIYPNPTTDKVQITLPDGKDFKIILLTTTGKIIKQNILNRTQDEVDLSTLPVGLYLLMIEGAGSHTIIKMQ
jgi:hypothetical protein